jgi:hypothetical protein
MSALEELLKETGDEGLDLIKSSFKELLLNAKNDSNEVIKETGEKIEKWLELRANGELDDDELEALLNARKRTVRQFLLMKEISVRASLEKISVGLIDLVTNKFIGAVF